MEDASDTQSSQAESYMKEGNQLMSIMQQMLVQGDVVEYQRIASIIKNWQNQNAYGMSEIRYECSSNGNNSNLEEEKKEAK